MRSPFAHILLVALGVCVVALSLYDVKYIEGASMVPTLRSDQTIFVFRWAYGAQLPLIDRYFIHWGRIKPYELVFLRDPVYSRPVVKRCIGVSGTSIKYKGDQLLIGNTSIPIGEIQATELLNLRTIPPGKVFVLGDNRRVSLDSRAYGLVDTDRISGRVLGYN